MWGTLRRWTTVGGVLAALLAGSAAGAAASFGDPVNCQNDPTNPHCTIVVGTPGDSSGAGASVSHGCHDGFGRAVPCYIEGKGWLGDAYCYYQLAEGADLAAAEAIGGKVAPPAYWYLGSCGDVIANFWPPTMITYRVYATSPALQLLAQEAVNGLSLPAPTIVVNPSAGTPQVVFVPTWLWIEPGAYQNRWATASIAGLSVTATAVPVRVTWSTGDGATVTCAAGTAWNPGADPAAASPDCGHTYATASRDAPGGTYTLRATITWQVTWTGGGTAGTEPALTSTSAVQLRVTEASVVNTSVNTR